MLFSGPKNMSKSLNLYLTRPVPNELAELERQADSIPANYWTTLCLFAADKAAITLMTNQLEWNVNLTDDLKMAISSRGAIGHRMFKDPILKTILDLDMLAQHWLEFLGWCQERSLQSVRATNKVYELAVKYEKFLAEKGCPDELIGPCSWVLAKDHFRSVSARTAVEQADMKDAEEFIGKMVGGDQHFK